MSDDPSSGSTPPPAPPAPPITLLSPADGQPAPGFTADPLTRVVIAGDEPAPSTPEGWSQLGAAHAWPQLMRSAARQGLRPRGRWAMVLDPGPDWRRHIAQHVQDQVEATMRENPAVRVLCVAILIDTATMSGTSCADPDA